MFSSKEKERAHKETMKMAEDQLKEDENELKKGKKIREPFRSSRLYSDKQISDRESDISQNKKNLSQLRGYKEHR